MFEKRGKKITYCHQSIAGVQHWRLPQILLGLCLLLLFPSLVSRLYRTGARYHFPCEQWQYWVKLCFWRPLSSCLLNDYTSKCIVTIKLTCYHLLGYHESRSASQLQKKFMSMQFSSRLQAQCWTPGSKPPQYVLLSPPRSSHHDKGAPSMHTHTHIYTYTH